jgi:choline transport protein
MSEEVQSAATVVPQVLIYSILINGSLGFVMVIVMMICMGDMTAALAAQQTMFYSALDIFLQAVNSTAGASLMASIVLVLAFACSVGSYATASRMLWSFSRDKGMPFHNQLAQLTTGTMLPITAVLTTLVITVLLSLIVLGSSVALNDVLNLSITALDVSPGMCTASMAPPHRRDSKRPG